MGSIDQKAREKGADIVMESIAHITGRLYRFRCSLRSGLPQEGWPDLSAGSPSVSLIESSQGSDLIIDPVFFQVVD